MEVFGSLASRLPSVYPVLPSPFSSPNCRRQYSVRAGGSGDEGKVARRKETNSWKIDFSGEKPATPLLDTINYPIHMRNLSTRDLDQLAAELRADIVYSVSKTGGHLSSSLGVVELSVALHHVFNTLEDKIIWDVGHQGERACGLLIWMDEVATEYAPGQSIGRVQIDGQEDETRTSLEEMKQEIKHDIKLLRESVDALKQYSNYCRVFQQCVEEIDLKGESFVDAEWMAYLGSFRHLRALNLADCRGINNAAIWSITGMTTLKELDLSRCSKVTDAGIEHLLSIPSLKKLCIPESGLTAKGIMRLSTLSRLSFLDLGGLPVTDLALHSLQALTQMEYLDLWGSKISNKGAEILKMFPKLNFLNLAWTNVTKLSKLPSLTSLNMSNCTIQYIFEGEDGVRAPLSKLVISGATFTDVHGAFSYMEASSLSVLDISNSTVQYFRFLEDMNRLEYLDVSSSRMEDDLLKSVACVGWNLKDLNLSNTRISTLGVATLAGKVPNLQTLCLSHTAVDDAALSYIGMMPSLRAINLRNTNIKGFTNRGGNYQGRVLSLTALQNLDHLEWLDLEDTQIRDEVLHPLSAFGELNHLSLKSDFLSDISLHTVSSLPKLKSLGIRGAVLSNNGLLSLQPPSMLQMLDLRECWLLTEDAISTFCRSHPRIVVQHELVHLSSICQIGGDGSSPSRGTSSASQTRLKKGKSSQASCRFRRENFVDERLKYSREELLRLQFSAVLAPPHTGILRPQAPVKE